MRAACFVVGVLCFLPFVRLMLLGIGSMEAMTRALADMPLERVLLLRALVMSGCIFLLAAAGLP